MLRGRGATSSVIQAAGSPGSGVSARPNALVVLVNTKLLTPAATASSSSVRVPLTVVSTNACLPCEPTWGLCSVAVCRMASTPARLSRTTARSATDPTTVVCGDGRTSSPVTLCPPSRSTRTRASPRWPELPVTRTFAAATPASVLTVVGSGQRVYPPLKAAMNLLIFRFLRQSERATGVWEIRPTALSIGITTPPAPAPSVALADPVRSGGGRHELSQPRGQVPGARGDLRSRRAGRGGPRGPPAGRGQRLRGQRPRSGRGRLDG